MFCVAAIAACAGRGGAAPDFTLQDDAGHAWSLSQQHGKSVLLTFGFTHCRDTCPATVAKLARIAALHRSGGDAEVAFITIDPARDTVPVLHRFVERFASPGARVVGLTGSRKAIEEVEAAYHVWSAPLPHDIAHTAVVFFIDERGRIAAVQNDDDSPASLSRTLAETMR